MVWWVLTNAYPHAVNMKSTGHFSRNFLLVHSSRTPRSTHYSGFYLQRWLALPVLEPPVNGNTILFCVQLLKFNRFPRLILVAMGVRGPPLFTAEDFSTARLPHVAYPFFSWYTLGLFPSFLLLWAKLLWTWVQVFFVGKCFSFTWSECL